MKRFFLSLIVIVSVAGAVRAADPSTYPLTTCVVSGEKLGSMGKPDVFTVEGTEVQLCCSGCRSQFDKDSQKYLSKIRSAAAATPAQP